MILLYLLAAPAPVIEVARGGCGGGGDGGDGGGRTQEAFLENDFSIINIMRNLSPLILPAHSHTDTL